VKAAQMNACMRARRVGQQTNLGRFILASEGKCVCLSHGEDEGGFGKGNGDQALVELELSFRSSALHAPSYTAPLLNVGSVLSSST